MVLIGRAKQRQHPAAQVPGHQLGRLDGDEDGHDQVAQRGHVGVVVDHPGIALGHRERVDRCGQAQRDQRDQRDDLGLGAPAEAERPPETVPGQRPDDLGAAEPRAVVAPVAEVMDEAPPPRRGGGVCGRVSGHRLPPACAPGRGASRKAAPRPGAGPLHPAERQAEVGDGVADGVIGAVAADRHQQAALVGGGPQAAPDQLVVQRRQPLLHLDQQRLAGPGEAVDGVGPQQPAALDRDQAVADPLDLAQQVGGDHDRDAELDADPLDQLKHRVPAAGSRPLVGSSSSSSLGSPASAWASFTRCFIPVE